MLATATTRNVELRRAGHAFKGRLKVGAGRHVGAEPTEKVDREQAQAQAQDCDVIQFREEPIDTKLVL